MVLYWTCIVAFLCFSAVSGLGTYRHVTVKGQVACGPVAVYDANVELWEKDKFDPDDLLNSTKTDIHGKFLVFGGQKEVGNIEPYIRIHHHCDSGVLNKKCVITDKFLIPKDSIGRVYDMGIISASVVPDKRKRTCE